MLMEELNRQILPILKEIGTEVVEYFEMTYNIRDYEIRSKLKSSVEYGLKRRNLTLDDFNHPYAISEILILVEEIKENNFNYF